MDRDTALVLRVLEGEMESFSTLVSIYQDRLFSFILKLTSSREDSEDILQDVFVRAYNYLGKYNSKWSFSTWIYQIAVNTFKDYYKRRKRQKTFESYEQIPEIMGDWCGHPESLYETRESYLEIVRLINNLRDDQRIALILKHIHGLTYREIGEILKISPENAKMKVCRVRQMIGEKFEEYQERCLK